MSWIRDTEEDLHNLDHVQSLDVHEVEGEGVDEEKAHGVIARFPSGDSTVLFLGTEKECRTKIDLIATKLPMVKV